MYFEGKLNSITTTLKSQKDVKIVEEIYYNTAKNFGKKLNITDYDMFAERMPELGIGQVRIVLMSDEKIIVQLFDCFTCGEMEYRAEPICYFEGGILAGVFSTICNQNMDAVETKCNGLGDNYCEFEITPSPTEQQSEIAISESLKKEDNMINLALHSLKLAKSYNKVEHKTRHFHDINQKLNKALKKAVEVNNSNKQILDNMPTCLALIDNDGVIVKINKQYNQFLGLKKGDSIENKNINSLGWNTKYKEVLTTGNTEIWQETKGDNEYIIFESPVTEGDGILRQLLPTKSEFVKLMLDKIDFLEKEMTYYKNKVMAINNDFAKIDDLSVNSSGMKEVIGYMKKVAKTDATVLLRGESGTGKSLFAKAIHNESLRSGNPFVTIDCTTIPDNFFEAEMFGYEPGAFTGANKSGKVGKIELADGGTVFLDEIGEIPLETQSKLLRFLQEKRFERIGGVTTKKVDVRIITATNQDLEEMVRKGQFRKDLYYRLNVINVNLPPLRERIEEIPNLINKILLDFCREVGIEIKHVNEEGLRELIHYPWPGNIRELENIIKRLAINSDEDIITRNDVLKEIQNTKELNVLETQVQTTTNQLEDPEKQQIIKALQKLDFNKTAAAKELNMTRQTLYNKIKKFNIDC